MNPTIIRHLLKTDWSRLKRHILCLWLLLALTALPWLLHHPAEFLAPTSYDDSTFGDIVFRYGKVRWANEPLKALGVVASLLAHSATWIGMLGSRLARGLARAQAREDRR